MKKKLITIILSLAMVCIFLAGCGSSGDSSYDDYKKEDSSKKKHNKEDKDSKEKTPYEKLFDNKNMMVMDENNLIGYIDASGEYVVEPQYTKARPYSCGYAAVYDADLRKWGYIDINGNMVIGYIYDDAHDFISDRALIQIDGNYGFIDTNGDYVLEPQYGYDSGMDYYQGYAAIHMNVPSPQGMDDFWSFVDIDGNILDGRYGNVFLYSGGVAFVSDMYDATSDNLRMINEQGETVGNYRYKISSYYGGNYYAYSSAASAKHVGFSNDREFIEVVGVGYCYVDTNGNICGNVIDIEYPEYDILRVYPTVNGMYNVEMKRSEYTGDYRDSLNWYGLIDENGNWVMNPEYLYITSKGNYLMLGNSEYPNFYVLGDMDGNILHYYDEYEGYQMHLAEGNNIKYMPATDYEGRVGCLNVETGEITIPFEYDYIGNPVSEGEGSYVIAVQNGLAGIMDLDGNWLIPPKFKQVNMGDYYIATGYGYAM